MLSNQVFRILRLFMHLLCTILGHDISNNRSTPFCFHAHFGIYLVGFQGQTCSHLCFLHCFSYISLVHMEAHFSINKVLPLAWLRRIKNWNSYQSLLQLYAKRASQPPSYLRSIIHIE